MTDKRAFTPSADVREAWRRLRAALTADREALLNADLLYRDPKPDNPNRYSLRWEPLLAHLRKLDQTKKPATEKSTTGEELIQSVTQGSDKMKEPRVVQGALGCNAQVGEAYRGDLVSPAGLVVTEVEGLDGSGLSFDPAEGAIMGTPTTDGRLDLEISGKLDREEVLVRLRLTISPDPWSLWKDIPTPGDIEFPKPDTDCQRNDRGGLVLLAASRRGRSHAHKGTPRDDEAGILFHPDTGWHIGAVADGAGSAEFSRAGSQTAVETVTAALPPELESNLQTYFDRLEAGTPFEDLADDLFAALGQTLPKAALDAAEAVEALAAEHGHPPAKFSTTLIIGAARHVPGQGWYLATFSVGDGLAGVFGADNPLMISADSGEFAGQTRFLTSDAFDDPDGMLTRLHHRILPEIQGFALMTDGVSDPMFASNDATADPAAWDGLWNEITGTVDLSAGNGKAHQELLDWLNFKVRGEHDDRTIVLMIPRAGDPEDDPSDAEQPDKDRNDDDLAADDGPAGDFDGGDL